LICPCIGMNRFTSHSTTPTATIVMMTVVSGISSAPILFSAPVYSQGIDRRCKHSGRLAFLLLSYVSLGQLHIRTTYALVYKRHTTTALHPRGWRQTLRSTLVKLTDLAKAVARKRRTITLLHPSFFQGHAEIAELLCSPRGIEELLSSWENPRTQNSCIFKLCATNSFVSAFQSFSKTSKIDQTHALSPGDDGQRLMAITVDPGAGYPVGGHCVRHAADLSAGAQLE
jgi:hypothetical protein